VTIARRSVDEDGDLRPGRTHGEGMIVRAEEAQGHEDGEDFGFRLHNGDRPQETRAERAFERVDAPDLLEQLPPGRAAAAGAGRWSVDRARRGAGGPLAEPVALVAVTTVVADLRHTFRRHLIE